MSEGSRSPVVQDLPAEEALRVLTYGQLELEGRLIDASNTTLRAFVTLDGLTVRCVYKPIRGERPLWDFPDGTLAGREVAAYEVSQAAGWGVVPPTVLREGPLGEGACQLWLEESDAPLVGFVPADALPEGWLRVASASDGAGREYLLAHADDEVLARMALFDVVVNNADRKGGHILKTVDGRRLGVDHGLCFHVENKLRTVLWGWAGRELAGPEQETLAALRADLNSGLATALQRLVTADEVAATVARVDGLLTAGRLPQLPAGRWAVPWPPI